jgi:dihydrofolate reductase
MIKAIFAVDQNWAIGNSKNFSGLPWENIPQDFKHFQKETKAVKNLFVGRTTFTVLDKITGGKLLPGRSITVISKTLSAPPHINVHLCHSPYELLRMFPGEDIMIGGGKMLYESCISIIDEIILTRVHASHEADCFLAPSILDNFVEVVDTYENNGILRELSEEHCLVTRHKYVRRNKI